jgi:hypothetical protein
VWTGWKPSAAYLAPDRAPLDVTMKGEYACVTVPEVNGHGMIVFEHRQ